MTEAFLKPRGLTQGRLAAATGVERGHVNELCNNRGKINAPTALILARVVDVDAQFWLNARRRRDLWDAMHGSRERPRAGRASRLGPAGDSVVIHDPFKSTEPAALPPTAKAPEDTRFMVSFATA